MSTDPTPAEIEAGAAAITRLGIAIGPHMRQVIAAAVLRASRSAVTAAPAYRRSARPTSPASTPPRGASSMADPTVDPAEIEAGMEAATVCGCSAGRKREVVTQVLAAVLPDHDARMRAKVAEEIAQAIEARGAVARHAVALEPYRHDEDAAIARAHTTTGEDT